ncbi:sterol desaturase family protein [Tropicibacter sp. R15_0]|uniref:sterol desaturase family protein n=1 Tax=Tropicibacter sp. R15_0 TaxID=2821101 RepID=UPI001AD97799|nr:sterol desaturase family protein [Tropicibacter sp. R15_0]MBO9468155.1 sterol desaturase family protein [Tropicibacter sp. R15_0]
MTTETHGHPIFNWPPKPREIATVLFGFPGLLWPWPALYLAVAVLQWWAIGASVIEGHFSPIAFVELFAVNLLALVTFVLAFHYFLYVRRTQGLKYKYSRQWPAKKNRRFIYANELLEGVFLSCGSAVGVWTVYTFVLLWMYHNQMLPGAGTDTNLLWSAVTFLLFPFWANVHFYFTHRWLHGRVLGKFHRVHHKAKDISPWSGLSMHPVEHLIYFSAVPIFVLLVPTHPVLMIYFMVASALGPTTLHHGFAAIKLGKGRTMMTDHYHHYLHHQFGQANFGATNLVPLDLWLKTDYQTMQQRKSKAPVEALETT